MGLTRNQLAWWLWAIGSVLVVLSWFDIVSTSVGWGGFVIGMGGSMLAWGLMPPKSEPDLSEFNSNDPDEPPPTNT